MRSITIAAAGLLANAGMAMAATPLQLTRSVNLGTVSTPRLTATIDNPTRTPQSATVDGSTGGLDIHVPQFDTSTGILLGANVTASGSARIAAVARSTATSLNLSYLRETRGSTTLAPGLDVLGSVDAGQSVAIDNYRCVSSNCNGNFIVRAPLNSVQTVSRSAVVPLSQLGDFIGTGDALAGTFFGTGSATVVSQSRFHASASMSGFVEFSETSASVTYSYLNFSELQITGAQVRHLGENDFGQPIFGLFIEPPTSGYQPVNTTLQIANLGDANSAGLSLVSITRGIQGITNPRFSTNLSTFTNLRGGRARDVTISFRPGVRDPYSEYYDSTADFFTLVFEDHAPGGIGRRTFAVELGVVGYWNGSTVPEPGSWAMMLAGFSLLGMTLRNYRYRARRMRGGVA